MAKKIKNYKLPKRIAGFKLNKQMRKGPLAELLASPFGQNLVGEVIYHAGAALVDRTTDGSIKRSASRFGRSTAGSGQRLAGAGVDSTAHVMHALREGANAFIATLRQHPRQEPLDENPQTEAFDTKFANQLRDEERRH